MRYAYWSAIVLAVGTEISAVAMYMQYWFPALPGWYWIVGVLVRADRDQCRQREPVRLGRVRDSRCSRSLAIVAFLLLGSYFVLDAPAGSGVGFANYTAHGGFFPKACGAPGSR